jgi:type III restriction enzyme
VQQVAFRLAREVVRRWQQEQDAPHDGAHPALPAQTLFPFVVNAARRFLTDPDKLVCKGSSQPVDVLLVNKYAQTAVDHLFEALRRGTRAEQGCRPPASISARPSRSTRPISAT